MENDTDARERLFHNAIREILIHALFFLILYVFAHILVSKFRKKKEYYFAEDDEDAIVCRVSLWMCCFSLAVSLGAALLLPVSIISNEVLLLYPSSFYVQWLNSSLIHGLWNEIFLFSNISIFILLPFAYLFTESEGLPGSQKGLISRFYETFLVFTLVAALLFGMTFLLSAILDYGQTSMQSLFALWCGYLPFLYSCLSCFGVVLLLICTPVGFARLFTVLGELVIKPKDEHQCAMMEEENLRRRAHIISHELEIHHSTPVQRIRRNGCAASALKQRLLQVGKVRRELGQVRRLCYRGELGRGVFYLYHAFHEMPPWRVHAAGGLHLSFKGVATLALHFRELLTTRTSRAGTRRTCSQPRTLPPLVPALQRLLQTRCPRTLPREEIPCHLLRGLSLAQLH
ncbi:hypothetical protein MRX96_032398 [Rhipicephalus microplus]